MARANDSQAIQLVTGVDTVDTSTRDKNQRAKNGAESELYIVQRYIQAIATMMQGQQEKAGEWTTLPEAVDGIGMLLGEFAERLDGVLETVQEIRL